VVWILNSKKGILVVYERAWCEVEKVYEVMSVKGRRFGSE
jgi:hypothetical protein